MTTKKKLYMAGSVTVYALLVFGIVMGLYMMGYAPIYNTYAEQQEDFSVEGNNTTYSYNTTDPGNTSIGKQFDLGKTFINAIIEGITEPMIFGSLLFVGVTSFITRGGTRYALTFIIPAIILLAILNIFVLPMSFIYTSDIPQILKIFVAGFLNLILMLTIVEFISGRQ